MVMNKLQPFRFIFSLSLCLFFVSTSDADAKSPALEPEKTTDFTCEKQLKAVSPNHEAIDQDASLNSGAAEPKALVEDINFIGNTAISDQELSAIIEGCLGKAYDFEGLLELASHVTDHYRQKKYPFATAIFPPQTMTKGLVIIRIVEGKYGAVKTSGEPDIANPAAAFLIKLKPGDVISEGLLNKTILIMEDLPGIRVKPTITAGEKQGLGDLDVLVSKEDPWSGSLLIDNHGEKSTGKNSIKLNLIANNLDVFGDSLTFSALKADKQLALADLKYDRPLGFSGARLGISLAKSRFDLGGDFIGFGGQVTKYKATVSYPFILAPHRKLSGAFTYNISQNQQFYETTLTDEIYTSGFDLGLDFEQLYKSNSGRSTKSSLNLIFENVNSALNPNESQKYSYLKGWLQHREPINRQLIASLEVTFQNSLNQKSHSSNAYSLGGPNNVRAYSNDEISGPSGYHTSLELSYNDEGLSPFIFYDFGEISASSSENKKSLAGAGFGARTKFKDLYTEIFLAFPLQSTEPTENNPKLWVRAQHDF